MEMVFPIHQQIRSTSCSTSGTRHWILMNFGAHGFLWTLAFVWCKQTQIFQVLALPLCPCSAWAGFLCKTVTARVLESQRPRVCERASRSHEGHVTEQSCGRLVHLARHGRQGVLIREYLWLLTRSLLCNDKRITSHGVFFDKNGHARQCMCSSQRNDVQFLLVQERRAIFASWYLNIFNDMPKYKRCLSSESHATWQGALTCWFR